MSEKQSYNMLSLRGYNVDDIDVCKDFNLPESLAYTPGLNDAMLNVAYENNIKGYMKKGMDEKEAKKKANDKKAEASREVKKMMAMKGLMK